MSFLELARKRCSIRKYAPKNVEQEKIDYILEAARLAPSAVNYQPWYFVWVQSAEGKAKLQECYPPGMVQASALLLDRLRRSSAILETGRS